MFLMYAAGVPCAAWFANFGANPDSAAAERGRDLAAEAQVDSIIALRRRQFARLRESDQFPADKRRHICATIAAMAKRASRCCR